ncbi:MAG: ArsR family transcriptional regulator [Trebonia sp.]
MYYPIVAVTGDAVPPPLWLIADSVRWRLLRELAGGDLRVRELVAAVGEAQNLVSYHLRQRVRAAGQVEAVVGVAAIEAAAARGHQPAGTQLA